MTPPSHDIDSAARLIRAYLRQHLHSADTAEGVHLWWLGGAVPRAAVDLALTQLAQAGELECLALGPRRLWRQRG